MILTTQSMFHFRTVKRIEPVHLFGPVLLRSLGICFFFLVFISSLQAVRIPLSVKDSTSKKEKITPFNPAGNYETVAIKARVLPWFIGDNTGTNILIGGELGFFKRHSISVDFVRAVSNENLDAYTRNDSVIRPIRERNKNSSEFHFAYNYHLTTLSLREKGGLSFYTGVNYRIGKWQMKSDTAMYAGDHTLSSSRRYYSFGPQLGAFWNIGKSKFLALNVNVTAFYNVKNVISTEVLGNDTYTNTSVFKTVDFRIGLNLYCWLKYRKR